MFQSLEKLQFVNSENAVKCQDTLPINIREVGDTQSQTITQTLDNLFPEQERENKSIRNAKEVLSTTSSQFNDQQIKDLIVEVQFLTESWLDDFERSIFKGLTLLELFHNKGAS